MAENFIMPAIYAEYQMLIRKSLFSSKMSIILMKKILSFKLTKRDIFLLNQHGQRACTFMVQE